MSCAVLVLGANQGEREETLRRAVAAVAALPDTRVADLSPLYETDPVGYLEQPAFLNMVVLVETGLSPHALLGACLGIEAGLGRRRTFRNAPRVIDIDVLLYEGVRSAEPELSLPHPRMGERAFVLVPLETLFPGGEIFGFDFSAQIRGICRNGVRKYGEKPDW